MKKRAIVTASVVAVVTLLGGALRARGIQERGPFLWDDAVLHLEAVFLLDSAHFLKESLHRKAEETRTGENLWTWEGEGRRFRAEVGGIPMRHGRPGEDLILAAAMSVLGRVDWAGPASSAFFGTLTIPALYFLGRALLGRRAALLAAAGLALLGYHVRFSREGLPEASSLFFVALAMLVYARSRPDLLPAGAASPSHTGKGAWLASAGLLTGIAFTIQDRTLLLFPIVLAAEVAAGGLRSGLRRFAFFFSLACAPILAFELPFYAIMLTLRSHGIAFPYRTYLEQVAAVVANHLLAGRYTHVTAPARAAGLLAYPYLVTRLCGPPFALLVATGILTAALRPTPARRFLLLWCLFGWIFLGLTAPLTRYVSIFLAPLVLLAALAMDSILDWSVGRDRATKDGGPAASPSRREPHRGHLTAKALCCALLGVFALAWEGAVSWRIASGVRPGYRDAVAWIASQSKDGVATHVSTEPFVSRVYAGVAPVAEAPADPASLDRLRTGGHRFYLVDFIRAFSIGPFAPRAQVIDSLARRCTPARIFPNAWAAWPEYLFEFNFDTLRTWRLVSHEPAWLGSVEVYDLDRCAASASPAGSDELGEATGEERASTAP